MSRTKYPITDDDFLIKMLGACSEISIPFRDDMSKAIIMGNKTATSRNKRYGKPGDIFEVEGFYFELIRVSHQYLDDVARSHWAQEGVSSEQEFIELWKEIHPRTGWEPDKPVWFHEFRRIK
jgi:hypothetical protein